ncbi:methyltransferase domain-containing protein [Gillisia sp. M10.2A]|uniref:Methyltransferase domain-containing protein n=1 Tax=Gillisia lutea TaxID=2909668 RepID=A0ABS9EFG8_9FLAO|nr:methyltransferase domain-containing protein [Gillisia lutea]MCF4101591.1 methyltransferase domain-containing protein [Gillisia lutea]
MINIDTLKRTQETEIMDDFDLQGAELEKTLSDLDTINKWLGGNAITLNGIKHILKEFPQNEEIKVVDVGCGNGAILREIAVWARKSDISIKLVGIDANTHAIQIAKRLSASYPGIGFYTLNIFSEEFQQMEFDIVLCTLTLHHFKESEIISLLQNFHNQSKLGIVINDLHRSRLAYVLFQAFCKVFINNEIARKDGLISILRGFKKYDLQQLSSSLTNATHHISWKWAFRYQWVILKQHTL